MHLFELSFSQKYVVIQFLLTKEQFRFVVV